MKCYHIYMTGFCLWLAAFNPALGQVDTTRSANYLVQKILLGSGVLVGNVTFVGEKYAIGLYRDSTRQLGFEQGIILTSGNAFYAQGPNKTPRAGWASDAPGDHELDQIARGKTYDASILEFDFVTSSEYLSFEFVFASEEYLEYVGSKFNDVFAFFITAPDGEKVNIAKLPDGITPITVNTVNNEMNGQYYINNAYTNVTDPYIWDVRNRKVIANENYLKQEVPPKYYTQFDGFTTVLKAAALVIPNKVYHIKIAIADVGDGILDSGVFLKAGSFQSTGSEVVELDHYFESKTQATPVERKSDALHVKPRPWQHKITPRFPIGKVEFAFDEFALNKGSGTVLYNVYQQWSLRPESTITVKGHTDSYGSDTYNINLSQQRAQAVAKALINMGVPEAKIRILYFGEKKPIATNTSNFGRARNRRVEFELVD